MKSDVEYSQLRVIRKQETGRPPCFLGSFLGFRAWTPQFLNEEPCPRGGKGLCVLWRAAYSLALCCYIHRLRACCTSRGLALCCYIRRLRASCTSRGLALCCYLAGQKRRPQVVETRIDTPRFLLKITKFYPSIS